MPVDLLTVDFPYYRLYVDSRFIRTIFNALKDYKPIISLEGDGIINITVNFDREKHFLTLSDYFTQDVRMKAKILWHPSPYDIFQERRNEMNTKLGEGSQLYSEIYNWLWRHTKMCSNFPITVVKAILDHYKPKRVFDPSAGWGDRMIACIASNISYTGVDPNRELVNGYQHMITVLGADPTKYCLVTLPIEEYNLHGSKKPDMIITSPPFFDMEHYSDSPNQSERKYPSYSVWKSGFLYSLLKRCYIYLEVGGHLIIYVNNIKKYPIFDDTKFYMENMVKQGMMRYEGNINWINSKYPKKMLVYKKLK